MSSLWGHQGGMGSPPMFLRELGLDSKVRSPLTFGIPGGRAPFQVCPPSASRPNLRLAFPKNRQRGTQAAKAHLFGSSLVAKGYQSWLWLSL